jgi:hypothetical protein
MKHRIAVWASVGFLVVCCWNLYALATTPPALTPTEPFAWALVHLTCPMAFLGTRFPISVYWVLLANTATYACVGLIVETMRRKHQVV